MCLACLQDLEMIEREMAAISGHGPDEGYHTRADDLLVELARLLGDDDVRVESILTLYEHVGKWYA